MAAVDLAAKRYALAAFELAKERGETDAWARAMDAIVAFMTRPDVRAVLENTRAARDVKQRLVEAGLPDLPPLALNFARLLVRKGRTHLVEDIAREFRQLVEEDQGLLRARAITAIPLNNLEAEGIARNLETRTRKRVLLETVVDPNILGGVVIEMGDKLLDASAKSKLEALRESLAGAR